MQQRTIVMAIVLFALIVIGMFTFTFLKRAELTEQPVVSPEEPTEAVAYASVTQIDAKHFFIDGTHTFAGEIMMPTPCDLLNVEAVVAESYPEQIMLNFSVVNEAENCAQVVTPARFKVSATASEAATVSAQFMGRSVILNLFPAAPGETPDDFELFIKG